MDRNRIGKVQVHQILHCVFQAAVLPKVQTDPFSFQCVFDIADKAQISIGYLICVPGLHNAVSDTECFVSYTDFIFRGAERVYNLTDSRV